MRVWRLAYIDNDLGTTEASWHRTRREARAEEDRLIESVGADGEAHYQVCDLHAVNVPLSVHKIIDWLNTWAVSN